jgi:hypothetical protein
VTVRQKIDQLAAEPPVRDLGYAADQRLVASALLGLQLLADEIDELRFDYEQTRGAAARPFAEPVDTGVVEDGTETTDGHDEDEDQGATLADVVDQLADLTAQMKKLTKAVRRSTDTDRKN